MIYPKLLTGSCTLVFFGNSIHIEFQVEFLGLFRYFFGKKQLRVALDGSSLQDYSFNTGVSQAFIVPTFSLLQINDVPDDIACNIAIYADNTALH